MHALPRPLAQALSAVLPALGTALACASMAWLMLQAAAPAGTALPLHPWAGIALACVLRYGWPALPGVAIGAFAAEAMAAGAQVGKPWDALPLAAVFALCAALQAGGGVALVRRFLPEPLQLAEPREVALFFGIGALACAVGAALATAALGLSQALPAPALASTWWMRWCGDTLGVMIGAPIALTLVGLPRPDWAPRRLTVGLTLALVTLVLVLAVDLGGRWDEERSRAVFDREADKASTLLAARLQQPVQVLQLLRGAFASSAHPNADLLRHVARAGQPEVATPEPAERGVVSAGFAQWLPRPEVEALESSRHAAGEPGFRVHDEPGTSAAQTTGDDAVAAVVQVEPAASHAAASGLNLLSIGAFRAAIDEARRSGRVAATAGLAPPQPGQGDTASVGLVQALYRGEPGAAAERLASTSGLVFVTLRPQAVLRQVRASVPAFLDLCIVDAAPSARPRVLAGSAACAGAAPTSLLHVSSLDYGGRAWEIRSIAKRQDLTGGSNAGTLAFALVGLLGTALLGAMLLVVTGRARRIEAAVQQHTADLEREVRERARADSALRASEQRFRNIFDNAPIGVVYTDLRGHVKQANPAFCAMLGYRADDMEGMRVKDYTHPDDWPQDVELSGRLIAGELPMYRRHKRLLASDGRMLWVRTSVSLLRESDGEPRRVVGVVEDITEHLKLEEAERAREVAESSNRAKSEFLSRMSHELRTPLNAMLGFAQLLELDKRHPLADSQRPWVAQIQSAGWHLLEMINDVLDLSRIESGTLSLKPEALDLVALLGASRSMLEADARQRGITITQDVAEDATQLLGDATRVKQILTNLLSNAIKYNSERGQVHIAARTSGAEMLEISVTDTGLGLTESQLSSLFQPFNRLGRERSKQQGTGIGLVISRRLAELMGGTLKARSVAGEGSSFVLTLPRVIEPDTVRSDLDMLHSTSSGYHRRIVHCVEDNETNVEVMRGILSERKQVQLDVSCTGLDALAAIRQRRPDLILLDMHLPDIDGMELLRHLKAAAETADIPVVVVSADAMPSKIEAALQAGALHYLTKPVAVGELLATLDGALEKVHTGFD